MTRRNETTDDVLVQPANPEVPPPVYSKVKTSWTLKGLLLLALAVAVISILTSIGQHQNTMQQLKSLRDIMDSLQTQQREALAQITSNTQATTKTAEQRLATLEQRVKTELEQRTDQDNDWLLLKARYYLELAQINALWGENLSTTSALLSQADALLEKNHNPNLLAVRQAIAAEKNQVSGIPTFDSVGVLTQLDAAQEGVKQLVVNTASVKPASVSTVVDPLVEQKESSSWRARLRESFGSLKQLVVVRHHNEDIQPLMTPVYEAFVREQIRLILQQVQWSVMQRNEALYQLNLKQAVEKIKQSFDVNDLKTQTLLNQIKSLQQESLTMEKPKIGKSLALLNQVIDANKSTRNLEDTSKKADVGAPS